MNTLLTKDDLDDRVITYVFIMDLNPLELYTNGVILFRKEVEFLGKLCLYEIINYDTILVVCCTIDGIVSLEPLYIQVDQDNNILDDFFSDFISNNVIGDYHFILEQDYERLIHNVSLVREFRVVESYF